MSDRPEVRGALWEVVLMRLLEQAGYRSVVAGEEGTREGAERLTVRGRGTWHECGGLAALDHTPAFSYPLRLVVEAKCYSTSRVPVGVVRNMVGVLRDINENYQSVRAPGSEEARLPRPDHVGVVCSSTGYTGEAQQFAVAHRVFLLEYGDVPLMEPVIEALSRGADGLLEGAAFSGLREARSEFGRRLRGDGGTNDLWEQPEWAFVADVAERLDEIGGSYLGMLQGRFPVHLLAPEPLPEEWFARSDEIECRARRLDDGRWHIVPSEGGGDAAAFEAQIRLSPEIERLVRDTAPPGERTDLGRRPSSTLHLSGLVGGVRRNVAIRLDDEWLRQDLAVEI